MDSPMTDTFHDNQMATTSMDDLKAWLEKQIVDLNIALATGVSEIKNDVRALDQTIHTSTARPLAQNHSTLENMGAAPTSEVPELDNGQWQEHCRELEERIHQLEQDKGQVCQDYDVYKQQNEQGHRTVEIKPVSLSQSPDDVRDLLHQLATTKERNQELQGQVTKLRDIILERAGHGSQDPPEFTISTTFCGLIARMQGLVHKFCRCDQAPRHTESSLSVNQREFFDNWDAGRNLTTPQRQKRTRAKIFELMCDDILCAPLFGLDAMEKHGELEASLARFEISLNSINLGHEADITEWRRLTMKCASWLRSPESRIPRETAERISQFMAPLLQSDEAEDRSAKFFDDALGICTDAFELTLLLRGCTDASYRFEIPRPGEDFSEEEAEEYDSEANRGKRAVGPKKIAFAISGTLAKYTKLYGRIVIEKAHVVTIACY